VIDAYRRPQRLGYGKAGYGVAAHGRVAGRSHVERDRSGFRPHGCHCARRVWIEVWMPGPGVAALRREWPGAAYETLTIPKAIYWPYQRRWQMSLVLR